MKYKQIPNQNLFTSKLARIYLSNRDDLDSKSTTVAKALLDWGENNDNGLCFRTNNDLANDTKLSARTIQRAIKDLVDKHLLIVTKAFDDKGGQLGNNYVLLYYKMFRFVDVTEDMNFKSIIEFAKNHIGHDTMTYPHSHYDIGGNDTMTTNDKELNDNVVVVELIPQIELYLEDYKITFKDKLTDNNKITLNEYYTLNRQALMDTLDIIRNQSDIKPFTYLISTFKKMHKKNPSNVGI